DGDRDDAEDEAVAAPLSGLAETRHLAVDGDLEIKQVRALVQPVPESRHHDVCLLPVKLRAIADGRQIVAAGIARRLDDDLDGDEAQTIARTRGRRAQAGHLPGRIDVEVEFARALVDP